MPDEIESHPTTDAVKALAHFLHEPSDDLPTSEIRSDLKRHSVDADRLRKRFDEALAQARGHALLLEARTKRGALLTLADHVQEKMPVTEGVRERVRDAAGKVYGIDQQVAVAWRKFKETVNGDLKTIIENLKLMDEIDAIIHMRQVELARAQGAAAD